MTLKVAVLALLIALAASSAAAQDMDAMAKWTAYTVVHYKVVGEHSGTAPLLKSGGMTYSLRCRTVPDRKWKAPSSC